MHREEANMSPAEFAIALQKKGVMMVPFVHNTIRAVTHVDVHKDQLQHVLDLVKQIYREGFSREGKASTDSGVKSPYGDWWIVEAVPGPE